MVSAGNSIETAKYLQLINLQCTRSKEEKCKNKLQSITSEVNGSTQ